MLSAKRERRTSGFSTVRMHRVCLHGWVGAHGGPSKGLRWGEEKAARKLQAQDAGSALCFALLFQHRRGGGKRMLCLGMLGGDSF